MINLIEKFDEGIIKEYWEEWEKHHPRKAHYASDLFTFIDDRPVGSCPRKRWYDWKGIKPSDVDPTRVLYMKVGSILHEHLFKSAWEKAGLKIDDEVELNPIKVKQLKYPIHGRLDIIVDNSLLVEIKTTQGKGITNKNFGVKYTGAKIEHILQLSFYKRFYKIDLPAVFIYFGRDNFYRTQIELTEEKIDWNDVFYRLLDFEKTLEENRPPSPVYDNLDDYPCSWCFYRTKCKQDLEEV